MDLPPLYPIVDVVDPAPAGRAPGDRALEVREEALSYALQLARGGAKLIQLRAKDMPAGALTDLCTELVAKLASLDCRLIVNDRADVATLSGAAGVHLGQDDLAIPDARRVLKQRAVIGLSTHREADAVPAKTSGANYLGFGPVFESPTKAGVREARGDAMLEAVCRNTALPVVAIGGITLARAPAMWKAGARSVAVISDLAKAADPERQVALYLEAHAQT